jgi:hypothetical protein
MKLNDVVTLSGFPGLYKVVKADTKAVIIEALDSSKKRQRVSASMMVSKLSDISIYTENDESEGLLTVLKSIKEKYSDTLPVNKKSSNDELMNFLGEVLPLYDKTKVYPSNVKKLVQWYGILLENEVEFEVEKEKEKEENSEAAAETETTTEA